MLKPSTPDFLDKVPEFLRNRKNWIGWKRYTKPDGKIDKKPMQASGDTAQTNNPAHWSAFDTVREAFEGFGPLDGLGFCFGGCEDIVAIDIDSCRFDDGTLTPWAQEIVDRFGTYTEVTPSGTGVRIIGFGRWSESAKVSEPEVEASAEGKAPEIRIFYQKGFITVTGQAMAYDTMRDITEALRWLIEKYFSATPITDRPKVAERAKGPTEAEMARIDTSPEDTRLRRCKAYLKTLPPSIEGSNGRGALWNAALVTVRGFALPTDKAMEALEEYNSEKCFPPWPYDGPQGLERVIEQARNNSDTPWGYLIKDDFADVAYPKLYDGVDCPDKKTENGLITPISVTQLIHDHPAMRPYVVNGLLRRGETANLIAAAKAGKSFMAGGLAWSVATGRPWLSHEVVRGRVLIIDNELHNETLANRLDAIADAMMIEPSERENAIDVIPLRGIGVDINGLGARINIEPGTYQLIVLDALYRFLPPGTSENDNAQMMAIYNRLDGYAKAWGSAIIVVHHASKGAQGEKAVTDVGAGAGSISRAADLHLIIRPHNQEGLSVMEVACRSSQSPNPVSIRYEYPLWHSVRVEPKVKKAVDERQVKKDLEANRVISDAIRNKWLSVSELRTRTGMGPDRIARCLNRIGAKSKTMTSKRTGKKSERYSLDIDENKGEVEWTG